MSEIFERRLEILLFMTYATNETTVKEVHELATTDLTLAAVKKIVREFLEGGYIESRLNGRKLFYRPSKKIIAVIWNKQTLILESEIENA